MPSCLNCNKRLVGGNVKYCSNKCQGDYSYKEYIKKWKHGLVSGNRGTNAKGLSAHLRRYIIGKYGSVCYLCGWHKANPITGNVSLEVDHIDGNADNNNEDNLRLVCPNCHSLTSNFKNLNKGRGRAWRKAKYLKS